MNYPKVSTIILNWNGLKDTIECLESLKKITYPNYRVIIVDNGSKNNEGKILKEKFGNYIHLIQNKENLGFVGGNNIGIRYALKNNADYVLLLNNDTIVEKNFLNYLTTQAIQDKNIGIVGPRIYFFDEPNKIAFGGGGINLYKGETTHIDANRHESEIKDNQSKIVDYIEGSAMLIRSTVFKKIGLLDEVYFAYWEDTDFSIRAKKAGFKVIYTPLSKIWHKVSQSTGGNMSPLSIYYLTKNRILFVKKYSSFIQKSFFIPFFILDSLRFFLIFKDLKRIRFYLKGLLDGLRYKFA
jgi:GT2 family glycosyltransferase